MRQIVLDTETTGLDWQRGHRIIEIGCVELLNRRQTGKTWHSYINPERSIDEAAQEIHGISLEDLADKPVFKDISEELLDFLRDAELIIHNAPFDVGFLDNEFRLAGARPISGGAVASVLDTLSLARQMHPGQRNSLDALCKRYGVDNARRELHGALIDARLLAEVYLAMTGGQTSLSLGTGSAASIASGAAVAGRVLRDAIKLPVLRASESELLEHETYLDVIDATCAGKSLWRRP
jgi:DNA polymerase-3 subunit epsilon